MSDAPKPPAPPAPAGGGPSIRAVPDGDDRQRLICPDCGYVAYENPKIVVGSIVVDERGRILLCRRAIEPRKGFWTLPAGYLELEETTEEGARREAWEEAHADIELEGLLAVYNIPRISQVQLIYRARFRRPGCSPGPETAELDLFSWDSIPWDAIAFPSVHWSLRRHRETLGIELGQPAGTPADATPGL